MISHKTKTTELLENACKLSKEKCLIHSVYKGCSSPMGVVPNVKETDWDIDCVIEGIENTPYVLEASSLITTNFNC